MGYIILVTGGARSGKSTFAEKAAKEFGDGILYIATSIPVDAEMEYRIKKHRERRPQSWETIEAYKNLDEEIQARLAGKAAIVLDCMTIMISNLMLERHVEWDNASPDEIEGTELYIKNEVEKLVKTAEFSSVPFIIVTNELGMGVVPEYASGRIFRDVAGRINQMLANAAREVYFCVSGIPVKIKG